MKCAHCSESHPDTFYFCTVTGADLQPWEYLVGKTYVERYRLKRLLDTAGRGALFEAETLAGGNKVAVKIIHPSAARQGNAAEKFIEDAATTGSLGHPHLPDGVEAGRDEGGAPYIVRRFVRGQSLASRLDREGPLPVDRAVRAAADVLSALVATHARGLCHLAITPSRIFLTDDDAGIAGAALLMDFGSAALTEAAEVAPYRAPEVTDGKGGVPADLYAVAASLYEVLTGQPPFGNDVADAHTKRSEVPEAVGKAIAKALSKDPTARFADAEGFLHALSQAMPSKPPPEPAAKPAAPKGGPKATMLGVTAPAPIPAVAAPAPVSDVPAPFAIAPPPPASVEPPAPAPAALPASAGKATMLGMTAAPAAIPETKASPAEPQTRPEAKPEPKPAAPAAKKPAPVRAAPEPAPRERDSVPEFLSSPPIHKRPAVLVGTGIALVLVVALVFAMSGGEEAPGTGIEGPSVRIVIRSSAPGAVLTVDGREAESNPFESRFAKSDAAHTVRAEAPGYRPREMLVRFDSDREIVLDLVAGGTEVAASAAPTPPPLPESAALAETTAPAPLTAAAPITAAPAPQTTAPEKVASAPERPRTRTPRPPRERTTPPPTKRTRTATKQQGGGFVTENPFD